MTLAELLAEAIFEAECGQRPNHIIRELSMWKARVKRAEKALEILEARLNER